MLFEYLAIAIMATVAAAVGLPVIGIFGSTDPEGTAPVTDRFTLIREAVSCSPCFLLPTPTETTPTGSWRDRCAARLADGHAVFNCSAWR